MDSLPVNKHNSSYLERTAMAVRDFLYDHFITELISTKRITNQAQHGNQVEEATIHEVRGGVEELLRFTAIALWS